MSEKQIIKGFELELCEPDCFPGSPIYSARAKLSSDASRVMPYLNSVLDRALFGGEGEFLIWSDVKSKKKFALRPRELAVSSVMDRKEARGKDSGCRQRNCDRGACNRIRLGCY